MTSTRKFSLTVLAHAALLTAASMPIAHAQEQKLERVEITGSSI